MQALLILIENTYNSIMINNTLEVIHVSDSILKKHMTKEVITVGPEKPIMEARSIMEENDIRRLPVVDGGELVGIVTEGDIQEAGPSDATSLDVWELNYVLSKTTVGEIMTENVHTITPDNTLEKAASVMRRNKVAGLPIMEDGELAGIITESDILDTLIELMGFSSEEDNVRVTVVRRNEPGTFLEALEPIARTDGNIISLFSHKSEGSDQYNLIMRIEAPDIEKTIERLKKKGIDIVDVR